MSPGRLCFFLPILIYTFLANAQQSFTINSGKLRLNLRIGRCTSITSMTANGQLLIDDTAGACTNVTIDDRHYSSLELQTAPRVSRQANSLTVDGISFGNDRVSVRERWIFTWNDSSIQWTIKRSYPRALKIDESATPVFRFNGMDVWDGAYQGYGGLAWFYLFNERLCTYGVHTNTSCFWNSQTGNGLDVAVESAGRPVAMKYTRAADDRLEYGITVSDREMLPRYDSGTNRRRFIRGKTKVWASFDQAAGSAEQRITLKYFDVNERYGRGKFVGMDGSRISAVLNTIARIGVIDSLLFGGNSWHTPYGPICLHEQYIAQLGLAIDDPHYLKGYQSCLDFYRDHAIRPDGRVIARWAYTDEDMMPGQSTREGFYEAQWGYLLDANPDFVTNVAELFDLTGDKTWLRGQQQTCEKALDWILARDFDGNGLVEMMTDNERQRRGSDWIDIIWASYENAFVNAKLYHALIEWAAIERLLKDSTKAQHYEAFAAKLKSAFNRPLSEGGFWDEEAHCYIHWRDKDGSAHGRNTVTPVNFMAIAYGICDDRRRSSLILDTIESQMQRERLFFWPLCMTTYAPGEGNDWQFPFPNYENGDLFLSWGSVAVNAYAHYKPELAVKYIRNVLNQYSQDGLAFQRYGRLHQNGLGDDILSGNSLSIVGLYQSVYGVNPRYNRLYLEPHITPDLAGTAIRYNFRNARLTIRLDSGHSSVGNGRFTLTCSEPFGYATASDTLFFFPGDSPEPALQAISDGPLPLSVNNWRRECMEWEQPVPGAAIHPATYILRQQAPGAVFGLYADGKRIRTVTADSAGAVRIPATTASQFSLRSEPR
ncbi:MAG TPA: trehalase family glycosidase [Puia sp.]|nr:trehalase family glycosidase [Puia sp.]